MSVAKPTEGVPWRDRSRHKRLFAAAFVSTMVLTLPPHGHAGVNVDGSAPSVRVEAKQASVAEILTALGTAFGLRYQASVALDRTITGTFSGPLERVIAQVLDGYDYVVAHSPKAVEIAVYARQRGSAVSSAANAPEPPAWRSSISRSARPRP